MSPLARIVVGLIAIAAFLIGCVALVTNRMESGAWQPPFVAMVSLSIGNLALLASCFLMWKARRTKSRRAPAARARPTVDERAARAGTSAPR